MRFVDGEMTAVASLAYRMRLMASPRLRAQVEEWRTLSERFEALRVHGRRRGGGAPRRPGRSG